MNKVTVKGSYTVEAALILPCILFIIIGLLYLGFYMHDKVRILTIVNETTIKGRAFIQNEVDIKTGLIDYEAYYHRGIFYSINNDLSKKQEKIYKYAYSTLSKGLFLAKVENIVVTANTTNIKVEVIAKMDFPFLDIRKLFKSSGDFVHEKSSSEIQNTAEFIRVFDVFSGVVEKVDIVDGTLKKLKKILSEVK